MDLELRGKVAIVNGSSQGMGFAIARMFAAEGAAVAMTARRIERLEEAVATVRGETDARAIAVQADTRNSDDCRRIVERTVAEFGGVDILVNNGGAPPLGPLEKWSDEDWDKAIDRNLKSVIRMTREVVPHMRARGGGRIIHITSISVKQPIEGLVLSNALRSAVTSLAKTLSVELAADNILVNCVAPGYTRTDRVIELADQSAAREGTTRAAIEQRMLSRIPMGRMGEPKEFGDVVAFLASPAASYVTGVTIPVDGGWTRGL